MLYRYFDCGIYDSDAEPSTTLWIWASSERDADERAVQVLAAAWNVPPERVCVQSRTMEFDVLRNAIEDDSAGDRRLWATGSWGERPTYFPAPVVIAAPYNKRRRLLTAFREAQAHALELATTVEAEALALRESGDVRQAEHHDYEAKEYRAFAASDLI